MQFKRFDFLEDPRKFKFYLRPVAMAIVKPNFIKYKPIIHYHNGIENLNEPFLMLCNHNAFLDFSIAYHLLRKKDPSFVVAIDGFIGREGLLRNVGAIGKRKFTNDFILPRKLHKVLKRGGIPVVYPEARYSLCGTTSVLPESLGKMVKLFKVPVATLICHGHHINSPFWDTSHERKIDHVESDYTLLFTKEEIETLSVDEINERIVEAFQYDDFLWQQEHHIIIDDKNRADGLEKVLYKCPCCNEEFKMKSSKETIYCASCNAKWEMTKEGALLGQNHETRFTHIPDWYEWERSCVREEIKNGTYTTHVLKAKVKSLPNAKKFIDIGTATFVHDMNGFKCILDNPSLSDTKEIIQSPLDTYSVHIEYRYLFKNGDCIDLNTNDDTWYVYPEGEDFNVTKISLATEELYFEERRKRNNPCKKGLA